MMMSDGRSNHWIHYSFQSFPLVWRRNQPWWISRLENCPILKQPPPWKEHDAMIESQNVIIDTTLNYFTKMWKLLWPICDDKTAFIFFLGLRTKIYNWKNKEVEVVHFKNNQVILPLTMYALPLTQRSESWKVIRFVTQRTSDSYCCTNGNCVLSIHWHAYLKVKYELFCEKNVLEIRSIYWNCELITNWEFDINLNDS